jgi:hypothetical protein
MMAPTAKRIGIVDGLLIVLGIAAGCYLAYQLWRARTLIATTAMVKEYETRRRGQAVATVVYEANGKQVEANLRVWTWVHSLEKGQQVPILYDPEEPSRVELDSFWQRYLPSLFLMLLGGAVGLSVLWRVKRRRASAISPGD